MTDSLFDNLEREWAELAGTVGAALVRWGSDDARLRTCDSIEALQAVTRNRRNPAAADAVLLALVARAADEALAARVVLQLLMPALKGMTRRYGFGFDSIEDCVQEVVVAALERIRAYPLENRPARVAANVVQDVRHLVFVAQSPARREGSAVIGETACVHEVDWDKVCEDLDRAAAGDVDEDDESPWARQLKEILAKAPERGITKDSYIEVVALTRLHGVSVSQLAKARGCSVKAIYRQRDQAERALGIRAA